MVGIPTEDRKWKLRINGQFSGVLVLDSVDQPWFICSFIPEPNFERYAETFYQEDALLQAGREDEWEDAFDRMSEWDVALVGDDGSEIKDLLLHISISNEARFRY